MSDLDSFLQGPAEPTPITEVVTPQEVAPIAEPIATGGPDSSPESVKVEEPIIDDRSKGLELELARVRKQKRDLELRLSAPETPKVDFWENQEGYMQQFEEKIQRSVSEKMLSMSEQMAKSQYSDFDEAVGHFEEMVNQNPALATHMMQSQNPAMFAYNAAKLDQRIKSIGDPLQFEERIRAEERLKVEAEFKAKYEADIQRRMNIPQTLSDKRAVGGNADAPYSPPTLNDILAPRKRR